MRRVYKISVAVVGTAVLVLGVVLIPYPGPGWLVVFAGLAILATEFAWARRVLTFVRARYDAWTLWLSERHWSIRLLVYAATVTIVLVTLWILGALGMVGGWVGLDRWTWLKSPIF